MNFRPVIRLDNIIKNTYRFRSVGEGRVTAYRAPPPTHLNRKHYFENRGEIILTQ